RWTGRQTELLLNWQIVNLKNPLDDFFEAPVLYLSGDQPVALAADEEAKLKEYIEMGGILLVNANCGSLAFTTSIRKLAGRLFPKYEFHELPPQHPIFNTAFSASKWKARQNVLGLSNGARELIVLIPTVDPARTWQMYQSNREGFQLGVN